MEGSPPPRRASPALPEAGAGPPLVGSARLGKHCLLLLLLLLPPLLLLLLVVVLLFFLL